MEEYKVYVQINENDYILIVNSSAFLSDTAGWIEIDKGNEYRHKHAQANYFPESIYTDSGVCRYKLVREGSKKWRECTPEEIAEQEKANKPIPETTTDDVLNALLGVTV